MRIPSPSSRGINNDDKCSRAISSAASATVVPASHVTADRRTSEPTRRYRSAAPVSRPREMSTSPRLRDETTNVIPLDVPRTSFASSGSMR